MGEDQKAWLRHDFLMLRSPPWSMHIQEMKLQSWTRGPRLETMRMGLWRVKNFRIQGISWNSAKLNCEIWSQTFFGAVNYRWFRSFFALNVYIILAGVKFLILPVGCGVEFGTSCWEGTPSYLMDTPHPFCWSRHAFLASTTWNATSSCKLSAAWLIDRTVQHQRSVDAKKVAKAWCPKVGPGSWSDTKWSNFGASKFLTAEVLQFNSLARDSLNGQGFAEEAALLRPEPAWLIWLTPVCCELLFHETLPIHLTPWKPGVGCGLYAVWSTILASRTSEPWFYLPKMAQQMVLKVCKIFGLGCMYFVFFSSQCQPRCTCEQMDMAQDHLQTCMVHFPSPIGHPWLRCRSTFSVISWSWGQHGPSQPERSSCWCLGIYHGWEPH